VTDIIYMLIDNTSFIRRNARNARVCSIFENLLTSTGVSACKPMRTERHVTFSFALTFTSSFASLSVSQPNVSTSLTRDANVNASVSASANVG